MFKNLFKKSHNLFSTAIYGDYNYEAREGKDLINSYLKVSPVFIATNMVSNAVADIDFVIHDKKRDEIIYNHPALDLINNPNPFIDGKLFINQLVSNYLLSGNAYIVKLMDGKAKTIELQVERSSDVSIMKNVNDGYANNYQTNQNNTAVYSRNVYNRFFSQAGNELIHLRNTNTLDDYKYIGVSFFAGCVNEINMYIASIMHNYNFIKSGANPSGLLTHKGDMPLTQEQAVALKQQIENTLKGSKNSGSVVVLGGDFDYKQTSQSIKDMDYQNLKEMIDRKIFQCLNIPVAKIQASAMTYSNLDVVKYDFYDNAVLPVFNTVARFLTSKLLVDYKNPDLVFTCDKSAIETLEARKITNVVDTYKNGLITRNEARTQIGYEASQNGDNFYNSATLIPAGEDDYTDDNRESPSQKELRRLMNESGLYTADEIDIEVKNAK
jgi:HK97 family phage portal protein